MIQTKHSNTISTLPIPTVAALRQSEELVAHIKNLIDMQGGAISFDEYMSAVLYAPGLGYYSAGSRKFGEAGDFITAPEISPLFAQCLAYQVRQVLDELDCGVILELGAGTGIMARDLLLKLEELDALPEHYYILEVSADLKQRQQHLIQQSIPHLQDRVSWLETLPVQPCNGLILANEVLDALAVKRFRKEADKFKEIKIAIEKQTFVSIADAPTKELSAVLTQLEDELPEPLPNDYTSEINTNILPWLSGLESRLDTGVLLFIDYGYSRHEYYHPQRNDGTLLCHYRHHVHADPLLYPGLQDITASVDFTAVAEAASQLDLQVGGYTNQAYFLCACGLDKLLQNIISCDTKTHTETMQQVQLLTMPEAMGERFKVLALTKNFTPALIGFSVLDQKVRL